MPSFASKKSCSLTLAVAFALGLTPISEAGDILRGGAPAAPQTNTPTATTGAATAQAAKARANAADALARTTQAVKSVQAMQAAARKVAIAGPNNLGKNPNSPGLTLPNVPNGLRPGGLVVDPNRAWVGANLKPEIIKGGKTQITIDQKQSQALLYWENFNIGKNTRVTFDQKKAGVDVGKWIAFNKITDPSGNPSQILGSLDALGQVYVINPNGIIFGGSSQINTRTFVASSLPINDNLIQRGLLNNPDAQFLFSGLSNISDSPFLLTGGQTEYSIGQPLLLNSDKTLVRNPVVSFVNASGATVTLASGIDYQLTIDGSGIGKLSFTDNGVATVGNSPISVNYVPKIRQLGDISVQPGALISSLRNESGSGGRIVLTGPNVINRGTISSQTGQAILAAGLQVAFAAHDSADTSLRGLDTWVGAVGDYAGTVVNLGLIDVANGSATLTGKKVTQSGVLTSSTSLSLSGRIDIKSSYDAVSNPDFDAIPSLLTPQFLYQRTGLVEFSAGSTTAILLDTANTATLPGKTLPQRSILNVEGLGIHLANNASIVAPNAVVSLSSGVYPYKDFDLNGNTFGPDGSTPEENLNIQFIGRSQRFLYSQGQIYLDQGTKIFVAGTPDVFVPLSQNFLEVAFRGPELADSPLQRTGNLRGQILTIDLRRSGVYEGRFWLGTPLGDATGLANIVGKTTGQLTIEGGSINLRAGESIILNADSILDVSGGYLSFEAGFSRTSRLLSDGRIIDISDAQPTQIYNGVFEGTFENRFDKYGIVERFTNSLSPNFPVYENGYVDGGNAGSITLRAPSMIVDGTLIGNAVQNPRSRNVPAASNPERGALSLDFSNQSILEIPGLVPSFVNTSPTPPIIELAIKSDPPPATPFLFNENGPMALTEDRKKRFVLRTELLTDAGFGDLVIENQEGNINVNTGKELVFADKSELRLISSNILVSDSIRISQGSIDLLAYNLSPIFLETAEKLRPPFSPDFVPRNNRGLITIGANSTLDVSGKLIDDRSYNPNAFLVEPVIHGGSISLEAFAANLNVGSKLKADGGAHVSSKNETTYGKGGSLSIVTGNEPIGGKLVLGATLSAFSGLQGGSLTIGAGSIRVGTRSIHSDSLLLRPEFFKQGGFSAFELIGVGGNFSSNASFQNLEFVPGVSFERNTLVEYSNVGFRRTPDTAGLKLELVELPRESYTNQSLTLSALGYDDSFTPQLVEIRGDILMESGTNIRLNPNSTISMNADTISLDGQLTAPSGIVVLQGLSRFITNLPSQSGAQAGATLYLGKNASISVAGAVVPGFDSFGRNIGEILDGGVISLSGNILNHASSWLDVSGTSATLDFPLAARGGQNIDRVVPLNSGLTVPLWRIDSATLTTLAESNAGIINMQGQQFLFSRSKLLGAAGGINSEGGTLSIQSSRLNPTTTADLNLNVEQVLPDNISATNESIGGGLRNSDGTLATPQGYFGVSAFTTGKFDSLELGGNVRFSGRVQINASNRIRLADGGIILADDTVKLNAPFLQIGLDFLEPANPADIRPQFYRNLITNTEFIPVPTSGLGNLHLKGRLVDLGTTTLQGIRLLSIEANNGDVRGSGTVNVMGDISIKAGQVYPTTATQLSLFAFDQGNKPSKIAIAKAGRTALPFSVGGRLDLFASEIAISGLLSAPLGVLNIGWDGLDFDQTTASLDQPLNQLLGPSGTGLNTPIARNIKILPGAVVSVSLGNQQTSLPYGVSTDGSTWIDPRGINITNSGLASKTINLRGNNVEITSGSILDFRGGGDIYAYRWIPGNGGSVDILANASASWVASTVYQQGNVVLFGGKTFAARVQNSNQTPSASAFWYELPESYAVLPAYKTGFAPSINYNTGVNSTLLNADRGYFDQNLNVGSEVFLDGFEGLPKGFYTLLPKRYALLPGAFLITAIASNPIGNFTLPDGRAMTTGYFTNGGNRSLALNSPLRTSFEISDSQTTRSRSAYEDYFGNNFFTLAAIEQEIANPQRLPKDGGYLQLSGNQSFVLEGRLLAAGQSSARGGLIDLASSNLIQIGDGFSPENSGGSLVNPNAINSWKASSVVIGGVRRFEANGIQLETRASDVVVKAGSQAIRLPDFALTALGSVTLEADSVIDAKTSPSEKYADYSLTGSGAAIRVSNNSSGSLLRSNINTAEPGSLNVGQNVLLRGNKIVLDSSDGLDIAASATISSKTVVLGSGQIVISLDDSLPNSANKLVEQPLVIGSQLANQLSGVRELTLSSYTTIDIYGNGRFGSDLEKLAFNSSGIRSFLTADQTIEFNSISVRIENLNNVGFTSGLNTVAGILFINANNVVLGNGAFTLGGFEKSIMQGLNGFSTLGNGRLDSSSDLTIRSPLITTSGSANHTISSNGLLELVSIDNPSNLSPGLGGTISFEGRRITSDANIFLPSGNINFTSTASSLDLGGLLNVSGEARKFYDQTRYTNAGTIRLTSLQGDVNFVAGSVLDLSASSAGGNAGNLIISATQGNLSLENIDLRAQASGSGGRFLQDTKTFENFDSLTQLLIQGNFTEEHSYRIREGDVQLVNSGAQSLRVRNFSVFADTGSISVETGIDASGLTGGNIHLAAGRSLTISANGSLDVSALEFNNAGKGGTIVLEAGVYQTGISDPIANIDLQVGALLDLSVTELIPGSYQTIGSSAFYGQFSGQLHLRAPRRGNDVAISNLGSEIRGASSILVEGFRVYDLTGTGNLSAALRDSTHADSVAYINASETFVRNRLFGPATGQSGLDPNVVFAPGVEIINTTGDLTLGTTTSLNTADWDLSGFRYGSRRAPGILTLRASGNLIFNNALSDGFTPVTASAANGHSALWLATLANINTSLPLNLQSWSYRLTSGADFLGANFGATQSSSTLAANSGSILVGQFYAPVPNSNTEGAAAAVDSSGLTANSIRISTSNTNTGTRYEVIRTGTGSISANAARDIQLRNQFATIYTAGVRIPNPTTVFENSDFVVPSVVLTSTRHPDQGGVSGLGAVQQNYAPQWALSGGDVNLSAGVDVGRFTLQNGLVIADSSRQTPTNWLYRRGLINNETGNFGAVTVFSAANSVRNFEDQTGSTTWWVDYSNFFEGVGTLGGGNASVTAGRNVANLDVVAPTNARMSGRRAVSFDSLGNPTAFTNIAPDASNLLELGGGDVRITAGNNIDGGVYYVERGLGFLNAGGEITTNSTRSPSLGLLGPQGNPENILDPLTWLPTTLYAGKAQFEVNANGNVLIGPTVNPYLLPIGLNNKFWYKSYFSTYSSEASVSVTSLGGDITHRQGDAPVLQLWFDSQNRFDSSTAAYFQPWIRSGELVITNADYAFTIAPPTLLSTAFSGSINVVGRLNLFPSETGTLELLAAKQIIGLQPTNRFPSGNQNITLWASAQINLSDSDPANIPSIISPLGYQSIGGNLTGNVRSSFANVYQNINLAFNETGSFSGVDSSTEVKQALHANFILHLNDLEPVRLYAGLGDISGMLLYSAKETKIAAQNDITDVSFYIQNNRPTDISTISSGRDIIPYNESALLRATANNAALGNRPSGPFFLTTDGTFTNALPGDLQISGPGIFQVLAGRNLDLGTGLNLIEGNGVGTGSGLVSIGNFRNPNLPFIGADIIALTGLSADSNAQVDLFDTNLNWSEFIASALNNFQASDSIYLNKIGVNLPFEQLTDSQKAVVTLEEFFKRLKIAGETEEYDPAYADIALLFGTASRQGDFDARTRDIRTTTGGSISLLVPGGNINLATSISQAPLVPPGIVTEFGGNISTFSDLNVNVGLSRIFTLRGGDIILWSSNGDIGAGAARRTVVTAPPTRVSIDVSTADLQTDLGGLATGGGIGTLASVEGVPPSDVNIITPRGTFDAGDAGLRVTGNLSIAALQVLNADNIQVAGTSAGVPVTVAPTVNLGGIAAANTAGAATSATASDVARQSAAPTQAQEELPSIIIVEVLGYGG